MKKLNIVYLMIFFSTFSACNDMTLKIESKDNKVTIESVVNNNDGPGAVISSDPVISDGPIDPPVTPVEPINPIIPVVPVSPPEDPIIAVVPPITPVDPIEPELPELNLVSVLKNDTFAYERSANTTFSSAPNLEAKNDDDQGGRNNRNHSRRSFMEFDISNVEVAFKRANLHYYIKLDDTSEADEILQFSLIDDETVNINNITWNNQPDIKGPFIFQSIDNNQIINDDGYIQMQLNIAQLVNEALENNQSTLKIAIYNNSDSIITITSIENEEGIPAASIQYVMDSNNAFEAQEYTFNPLYQPSENFLIDLSDNVIDSETYYELILPDQNIERYNYESFKAQFLQNKNSLPVVDAKFYNSADLGLGRELECSMSQMDIANTLQDYMLTCVVSNHGAFGSGEELAYDELDQALNPFAKVAMVWDRFDINNDVKFFVFDAADNLIYDNPEDEFNPKDAEIALDNGEEKSLPELCMNCHGGVASQTGVENAHFLPLDVYSFEFENYQEKQQYQSNLDNINQYIYRAESFKNSRKITDFLEQSYDYFEKNDADIKDNYIPPEFSENDFDKELYTRYVKPLCRGCHLALETDLIPVSSVFTLCGNDIDSAMPHAEVNFANFLRHSEYSTDFLESRCGLKQNTPILFDFQKELIGSDIVRPLDNTVMGLSSLTKDNELKQRRVLKFKDEASILIEAQHNNPIRSVQFYVNFSSKEETLQFITYTLDGLQSINAVLKRDIILGSNEFGTDNGCVEYYFNDIKVNICPFDINDEDSQEKIISFTPPTGMYYQSEIRISNSANDNEDFAEIDDLQVNFENQEFATVENNSKFQLIDFESYPLHTHAQIIGSTDYALFNETILCQNQRGNDYFDYEKESSGEHYSLISSHLKTSGDPGRYSYSTPKTMCEGERVYLPLKIAFDPSDQSNYRVSFEYTIKGDYTGRNTDIEISGFEILNGTKDQINRYVQIDSRGNEVDIETGIYTFLVENGADVNLDFYVTFNEDSNINNRDTIGFSIDNIKAKTASIPDLFIERSRSDLNE